MDLAKSDKWEFLEGWMLHGKKDVVLTIKGCTNGNVFNPKTNETKDQYQLIFDETPKKLILNKTNLKTCVGLLGGSETDQWLGRRIAVYSEWLKVGGKQVLGVRIRDKEPPPRQPTRREMKENGDRPMTQHEAVQGMIETEPEPSEAAWDPALDAAKNG